MSAKRMESAAVGGVREIGGKFVAFFEHHEPCLGGHHTMCTVKRRDELPPVASHDEAMERLAEVVREVGWESEHDA